MGNGLKVWDGNGYYTYTSADGLISNSIYTAYETEDGKIWISAQGGLHIWDGTTFSYLR